MGKKRLITILLCVLLVILLAFVITGGVILHAAGGSDGQFQYLIVLGTTVNGAEPSPQLSDRIYAAYVYADSHPDVYLVVSGGKGTEENLSEAECMYKELTALGIDQDRILLEDQATSTLENLEYSMALIEMHAGTRPETVGLLSSEYHLLRANMFAKRQHVNAVTIPAASSDFPLFLKMFLREIIMVWYYSLFA